MSVIVSVVGGSSVVSSKELVAAKGGKPVRIKAIRGGKYVLAEGEQRIGPENITVKRVGKNLLVALEGTQPEHAELIIEDFFGSEGQLVGLAEDGEYHEYIAVDGEQASAATALYDGSTSPLALGTAVIGGIASTLMTAPVGILPYVLAGLGVAAAGVAIERHNDDDSKPQPADTTPPENKGIGSVIDDKDGGRTELKDGASTNDNTPTLVGGGQEPGDTVTIIDNGKVIGEVIVDDKGEWSFTPEKELGEGEHVLEVVVTDPAGNASKPSDDFTIIVDTTAPAKPVIGSVVDDQGAVVGPIAKGGSTDDTLPTLNGTAEPGTVVHIYDNGKLLGSASVDGKGAWSFTPSTPLGEGEHVFTVTCSDAAGNTSSLSDGHLIVVDTSAPGKPNGADSMLWDDEGPVVGEIKPGDTTDDRTPTFSGKGEPGATVVIQDNGKEIGRAPVGDDGKWSFTPDTPLNDGAHSLDYFVVDGAGNAGQPSDPIEFVVDTSALSVRIDGVTDNVGSVTGPVAAGGVTDDATPTVHGSATPGATVEIHANGVLLGKTTVNANGTWSYMPATALADGSYAIKAVVVAATGASQSSTEFVIEVDTTAPGKPSAADATLMDDAGSKTGLIRSGDTTDDTTPTFSGRAEEGATIVIYDNGSEIGRVVVEDDGDWEFTPENPLVEGDHSFSYEVVDTAGNISERSDSIDFNVDTSDARVFIEGAVDNVGSKQGDLESGSVTDDATPTLHGSGTVGGVVKIYDGAALLGETMVGADGRWSFTPAHPLTEGQHNLSATVTTPALGEGKPTSVFELLIDLTAPDKPSIGSVYDDQGEVTGDLTSGQVTDDAKPELKGKGEPNSTIIVKDNGVEIGRAPVDADGNWSFVPETPLLQGEHPLTVVNVDAAGNESLPSDAFVVNVGSSAAPAVPSVTGVIDDVGTVQGNLQKNAITDDARPTITGTAQPGMTISVYDNGKLLGTTQVDAKGEWSFTPTTALADGPHNLTAKATNAMGNSSPETGPYPIVVDTAAPAKPGSGDATLTDNEGSITGEIKPGDKTDDSTPTFAGKTEPGAEVVIHDNGKEIGRVTAGPEGNWTFTPTTPLADGDHSLSYEVVDQAGNVSEPSDPLGFVVDTRDVTVRIDGATDNAGKVQGAISAGGVTDDATPTLHGQATPGGTVKIYDGGVLVGQTTADAEGKWSLELPAALAAGPHSLTATVTTAAGGESAPTPPFTLTVDLSAPNQPVISSVEDDVGSVQGAIGQGKTTDDTTPTLKGTAEAGSTVHIYDNGSLLGSVVAGSNGVWGYTPTTPLNNGSHSFTVTSEDKAGNVSTPSDAYAVIVDTVPPGKPSIGSVYDDQGDVTGNLTSGQVTDDAKPELKGTAEPNSTIIVKDNGVEIGRAPVDADGNWSFVPETPLLQGEHPLTVVNVDAAGNESQPSDAFVVNVGSSAAPPVPSVTGVIDDVGTVQGNLQKNAITDDARPTITGTAQPGMTISVYDNGKLLGTTEVNAKGEWSFTPTAALSDGPHNLTAKATNAMGNSSPETGPYPIVVDTAAPAKPGSGDATLTDNEGSITGEIKPGDKTDDSTPTFAGKTEPGAEVVIHDNGKEIGRVTAGPEGNWTFTPTTPLVDGDHSLSYEVVDQAGNVSEPSDPLGFVVDTRDVTVRIDGATDNAGKMQGAISAGGVTDDATPTLHGQATPGGTVKIYDGGVLVGQTTADAEGKWSLELPAALAAGPHSLTATVTTAAGGESAPTPPFTLTVDLSAPNKPVISSVEDDVGSVQGAIGQGKTTDDTTPTLKGTAEAGSTVHIYDNGSLLGSVVAGSNGVWNYTPTTPLNNGPHSFTVTSEDKAGNVSTPSDAHVVIVDTVPPGKPSIESVMDDEGGKQGKLTSGDLTDDAKPELSGKAEPNGTVIIKDNGEEIGRAPVDANGNWTFTPTLPLGNGLHELTVEAMDAAGNVGQPSAPFVVDVLNDGAPAVPSITGVMDDVGAIKGNLQKTDVTDDARPTVNGTAEPGVTVSVYSNGTLLGIAVVNAKGEWSFTPKADLADGLHNITAKATNSLGNDSEMTGEYPITVDTLAPGKPGAGDADLVDNEGSIQGTITNGSITDDSTPTFSGSNAEPNATVVIHDNGKEIGRVPTDANGNWTFTPAPALVDGAHSMSYQVVDKAGNVGEKSDPINFTLDSSAVTVRIEGATDNVGGVTGELANGGVTDDATPTLHGTATAGGTVKIYDGNNVLLGETIANAEGKWSFTPATPLPEGAVTLYATVTTGASEESDKTPAFNLILDMTAPLKPVIEKIEDDVGNPQGVLANGQSTDDTTPTLSGKAEAGSTVRIYDNGSLLGSVVVDGAGNWNFTPTTPLNNGPHSFTVTSVDPAGNVSVPSDAYVVTVDTVAPGKPAIGSVYDDQGGSTGNLVSGDETDDTRPELKGTGEPNSTIIVKDNGVEIGRVPVDANGNWSFVPTAPLADGEHPLTVVNVDAAGNESRPSDPFVVIVDGSGGGKPEITAVMDDQGPKQGLVNAGESTDDVKPQISGTAKPNSTVSIWDNNVKIGQVQSDAAGNWTFTPDAALQEGSHSIHVTAVDALGSEAEPSAPFAFEVNTGTPETPRINYIYDDVGGNQGMQRNGGHSDDIRPELQGTGKVGDTIEIRVDGMAIGRRVVGADGRWSVTSSVDIAEGLHTFTAVAVSPSGVESGLSNSYTLTIDTTPPEAPVVISVTDNAGSWRGDLENGAFTDDRTPTFSGKADPYSTLVVYINGEDLGVAYADADGNWKYTPDPLTYGEYTFNFEAWDRALNQGEMSENWVIYVGAASRSAMTEVSEEGLPYFKDVLADTDADLLVQSALMEPGQAAADMDASQVSAALQQGSANADAGMQVGTGLIAKMEDLHVIESPLLG